MRVLITRPEADAISTARRVEALGHEPIIAPLTRIVPTGASIPDMAFDGLIATSRHAIAALAARGANARKTPLYCVGQATAAQAETFGFENVIAGDGTAAALLARLRQDFSNTATLLYAAGSPRKPDLEQGLARHCRLIVVEVYRAEPEKMLPEAAKTALLFDSLTVLHLSRHACEQFLRLSARSGVDAEAKHARHLVLSQDVAEPLLAVGATDVSVALKPTLDAVLDLLSSQR